MSRGSSAADQPIGLSAKKGTPSRSPGWSARASPATRFRTPGPERPAPPADGGRPVGKSSTTAASSTQHGMLGRAVEPRHAVARRQDCLVERHRGSRPVLAERFTPSTRAKARKSHPMAGATRRRTRTAPLPAKASSMATNSAAVEAGLRTPLGTGRWPGSRRARWRRVPAAATTTTTRWPAIRSCTPMRRAPGRPRARLHDAIVADDDRGRHVERVHGASGRAPASGRATTRGHAGRGDAGRRPEPDHWFEPIADHLGAAYLRYSFTKGTVQEVDFLVDTLGLGRATRVLDVGCGPGRHAHELARRGIACPRHRHQRALHRAGPRGRARRGDVRATRCPAARRSTPSSTPRCRSARAASAARAGRRRGRSPCSPAWRGRCGPAVGWP